MQAAVWARMFGQFRLFFATRRDHWIEAPERAQWGHGRSQELLALLLMQRRALTRGEAAAALWPESDGARRTKLLRNALWNLRSALERMPGVETEAMGVARLEVREEPHTLRLVIRAPAGRAPTSAGGEGTGEVGLIGQRLVAAGGTGYSVSSKLWCDALAFETACQRAGAAATGEERLRWSQRALSLYSGVFMPGMEHSGWVVDQRSRQEERWARLCVDASTALRHMREPERALALLLTVMERQPQHAEAAHHAMMLLASAGKVTEALSLYDRARRAFRESYGSESGSLRRLAAEIRSGQFMIDGVDGLGEREPDGSVWGASGSSRPRGSSGSRWRINPPDVKDW